MMLLLVFLAACCAALVMVEYLHKVFVGDYPMDPSVTAIAEAAGVFVEWDGAES